MRKKIHIFYDKYAPSHKLYFMRLKNGRYYYKKSLSDIYKLNIEWEKLWLGSKTFQPASFQVLKIDLEKACDYVYLKSVSYDGNVTED